MVVYPTVTGIHGYIPYFDGIHGYIPYCDGDTWFYYMPCDHIHATDQSPLA